MKLSIISTSEVVLDSPRFERVTLMTEAGEITILPQHEPLLSAVRPGVMHVEHYLGNKLHTEKYAMGGGVLNIGSDEVVIMADIVEHADDLTDLEYIESQKQEAESMMKKYREENGAAIDPHKLVALEYELLKYSAMHQLKKDHAHLSHTSRK